MSDNLGFRVGQVEEEVALQRQRYHDLLIPHFSAIDLKLAHLGDQNQLILERLGAYEEAEKRLVALESDMRIVKIMGALLLTTVGGLLLEAAKLGTRIGQKQ